MPVLLVDRRTRAVAAFHAGWRGTLARIVACGVQQLCRQHGSRPRDLAAAVGPAIRPCCFEVGEEVRSAYMQALPNARALFSDEGHPARPRLDLQEANRQQLLAMSLAREQIHTLRECTACCRTSDGRRKYFSYRAEGGVTGRMLSVVGASAT